MTAAGPPHNLEAEQGVLGAILINNDSYGAVAGIIKADDFYEPLHQIIYRECGRQIVDGKRVTPITLKSALPDVDMGDGLTVNQYIARLCSEATTIINAPDYAGMVHILAVTRELIAVGDRLREAQAHCDAPDVALRDAWAVIDDLRAGDVPQNQRETLAQIGERLMHVNGESIVVPSTGFTDLDRAVGGGYRAGRLFVFAGRPGMGKSVVVASSARRVAKRGYGVAIFSLEIDGDEMLARIAADEMAQMTGQTPHYRDILTGELDEHQHSMAERAIERVRDLPIELDTRGGLSCFDISARARVFVERWSRRNVRPGVIFIDYLGLISPSDRYRGRKVDEMGEIAKSAKELSKQLGLCIVLLSQLNRSVEGRDDKRPNMADLRDSGNIEEHADVVGLLYRPNYYDERVARTDIETLERTENRKRDLDLILGKNRLGPTETIHLWCDVARSTVDNKRVYE